jgi:hypothetical protein
MKAGFSPGENVRFWHSDIRRFVTDKHTLNGNRSPATVGVSWTHKMGGSELCNDE